ncbi:MAG: PP0621 family protein [Pseudomonadota bacterium]
MKFLLWGVIGFIVVMWVMRARQKPRKPGVGARKSADLPEGGGTEEMIRCAHCGIYIPASEAVVSQADKTFCSDEHRKLHISG